MISLCISGGELLVFRCRECITAELAVREKCPLCRTELQVAQLVEGVSAAQGANGEGEATAGSSAASQAVVSESKLRALLKEVGTVKACCAVCSLLSMQAFLHK